MKVTINPQKGTHHEVINWSVDNEPSRVSVDTEFYSYSIVLAPEGPQLEVWELDHSGEQLRLLSTQSLPN